MAGLLYIYTHGNCDCYSPCGPCGPCDGNCDYEDENDIIVIPNKVSQLKSFLHKLFRKKLPTTFCERLTSYNTNNEKLQEVQEVQESQNVVNQKWMPIPEDKIYTVGNSRFCSTPTKPSHTKNKTTNL